MRPVGVRVVKAWAESLDRNATRLESVEEREWPCVTSGNDTGTCGIAQFRRSERVSGCGRENTYCEGLPAAGRLCA